jgi:ATP dependent DNA ligase domain
VVVASGAGLDFEALLQRIHPADSRVRLLAAETPALLIAFDLLSLDDRSLLQRPFAERRAALEAALAGAGAPVHTTPVTGRCGWRSAGFGCWRAPGWTAWSPSPPPALPGGPAGDVQGQA